MHRYALPSVLASVVVLGLAGYEPVRAADGRSSAVVVASDSGLVEIIDDRALTPEEAAAREPGAFHPGGNDQGGCGCGSSGSGCNGCNGCNSRCGKQKCGLLCRLRGLQNSESWTNCDCNGSYKFPVPPLFTYHWPGLYSQQLMTDYHSPWRFLPIRPYEDEDPLDVDGAGASTDAPKNVLRPVSHDSGVTTSLGTPARSYRDVEPVSVKMRRRYGG